MSLPPLPRSSNQNSDLSLIEEISRSILSNLDREGLLNSSLTLLHRVFGFSKVAVYTTRGRDKTVLKKISISTEGLDPESIYRSDADPGPVGWSVAHQEPVHISDTSIDDRFLPGVYDQHTCSELVIPLLHGETLLGILDMCAEATDAFSPESVIAFEHLADYLAIAIRNASLYRAEQSRRLVAERLQDAIGAITVDISLDDVFKHIFDELEVFLPWEAAALWLVDTDAADAGIEQLIPSFHLAACRQKHHSGSAVIGQYLQSPDDARQLFLQYPWTSQVITQKLASVRGESADYEPIGALLGFGSRYSALAAPLLLEDQALGVIVCLDPDPEQYDDESISVMEVFAEYISTAIENTRLYSVAHDQAWITTVLLQVAEATQSITTLDDLLETIASILPGLIGANACAIFLWEPSIESFYYEASSGFDDEQVDRLQAWDASPVANAATKQLLESRGPVILDDEIIPAETAATIFPDYDFDNDVLILFPLLGRSTLTGAILVDFVSSELALGSAQEVWDEKYTLVQGAANQAANAIENLQLIKSQAEEAYISVALLQVAQAVVSLKQLDEILATIVRITPILVGVKRSIIYIWDGAQQLFHRSQEFGFSKNDLSAMGEAIKSSDFPLLQVIKEEGKIIYHALEPGETPSTWRDISSNNCQALSEIKEGLNGEEISVKLGESEFTGKERLLIGFPLSVKSETLGVMLVEEEEPLKGILSLNLREKRIQIVKGITQQAAIAIKNEQLQEEAVKSERMERELQLAREIQVAFLPKDIPVIPGWDIDVHWQPAREVGGDFYDILQLDEHKIGFIMADVADKGMPAALFMTLIRTLMRATAKDETSPAAVLKQVNELLIPDTKNGMFVTLFFGVIDTDTGTMVYANAGHNPPLVKRHDQVELQELTRTSIALGLFSNIEVEERVISLGLRDCVFLYTDGITEAFSAQGEMFGVDRLKNLLKDAQLMSAHRLSASIIEAVQEFIAGAELSDDITVGVILRKAA